MQRIQIADGVDIDAALEARKTRSPKAARVLYAISRGWDTLDGVRRAMQAGGETYSMNAIRDHIKRLSDAGLVTYNTCELLFDDIPDPEPGGVLDGVTE